jgi:hypothetical protein
MRQGSLHVPHVVLRRVSEKWSVFMRATTARLGQSRPGFLATSVRIVWVLTLTISAVVGAVLWQARTQCPEPCRINGMTAPQALKGPPSKPPQR